MYRQWVALITFVLVYIPVAIEATVLYVAAPTLSTSLGTSGNELLWIIDIYPLVMAGIILPMDALGNRIGFKRLLLAGGALFGLSSLIAALAGSAALLITARVMLAVGAAMIIPATLAGIRVTFPEIRNRNTALGVWAAVGSAGAAFGPSIGGFLLEHFYWGSVFLMNVPFVLVVLILGWKVLPQQTGHHERPMNIGQGLMLIAAILMLVYSAKTVFTSHHALWIVGAIVAAGLWLLVKFIRIQCATPTPMIDIRLFTHPVIVSGVIMILTSMITLVGFQLLMAQELQFVHAKTALQAGLFMLPVMLASSFSGPIAGWLVTRLELRRVATAGMTLSAISFLSLSWTDFSTQPLQAWIMMTLLGFSAASALLASTAAIMTTAPKVKAAAAGAIETMAYELGAGLGIALFGLILTRSYHESIVLPADLDIAVTEQAASSIGEAFQVAQHLPTSIANELVDAAKTAFITSHNVALISASGILILLAIGIWFGLAKVGRVTL